MPVGDQKTYDAVRSFLERQHLEFTETDEQHCTKITIKNGAIVAHVSVFNSGKIVIGGKASPIKSLLDEMKAGIERGFALPGHMLPFEIDRLPQTLLERAPDCDPVIIAFIDEALRCYRAEAYLGAAFMTGAASEKAVNLLIYEYAASIRDQKNRDGFLQRVNGKMISKKYEAFTASYRGCQNRPTEPAIAQDLDVVIGNMFQFCRITRNEVGHPQIVPDLDRGVLLANLGHIVTYIERIYKLMKHFRDNGVNL